MYLIVHTLTPSNWKLVSSQVRHHSSTKESADHEHQSWNVLNLHHPPQVHPYPIHHWQCILLPKIPQIKIYCIQPILRNHAVNGDLQDPLDIQQCDSALSCRKMEATSPTIPPLHQCNDHGCVCSNPQPSADEIQSDCTQYLHLVCR